MNLRMLTVAAVLSLSFAGAAYADGKVTASLKAPVAAKTKVVAGGAVFVCEGDTCVRRLGPGPHRHRRRLQGPGEGSRSGHGLRQRPPRRRRRRPGGL